MGSVKEPAGHGARPTGMSSISDRVTAATAVRATAVLAGALALAACGSTAAPSGSGGAANGTSSSSISSSPAAAAPKASLSITVLDGPGSKLQHWTLRCDPAGGTHPHAAAACAALLALKTPFAKAPAGQMCPMILASAKRATFTGTWYGQKVDRTIVDGGCDLAKWSKLGQVMN
jgi:Subtilisin inhibitor-like